jgi:hypothetical protein
MSTLTRASSPPHPPKGNVFPSLGAMGFKTGGSMKSPFSLYEAALERAGAMTSMKATPHTQFAPTVSRRCRSFAGGMWPNRRPAGSRRRRRLEAAGLVPECPACCRPHFSPSQDAAFTAAGLTKDVIAQTAPAKLLEILHAHTVAGYKVRPRPAEARAARRGRGLGAGGGAGQQGGGPLLPSPRACGVAGGRRRGALRPRGLRAPPHLIIPPPPPPTPRPRPSPRTSSPVWPCPPSPRARPSPSPPRRRPWRRAPK